MRGNAKLWSDTQPEIHKRWEDYAKEMMENLTNHRQEADGHIELSTARRGTSESFSSFYHRMCAVARGFGINDASTVKYIRNGLNHNGLRNIIAGMNFNNCLELYAYLYRFEQNLPHRSDHLERTITQTDNKYNPSLSTVNVTDRPATVRRDVRCYNCNENGHVSINCTKPQRRMRCLKCQRSGHSARDCPDANRIRTPSFQQGNPFNNDRKPTPQHENALTANGANVRQICENSSLQLRITTPPIDNININRSNITKQMTIGNHHVNSFVDPGSDRSLVRGSSARSIGEVRQCNTLVLKGFGGGTYSTDKCVETTVQIDQVKVKTSLFIVDDELLPEDILLGKDILCRPDVRLVIENGTCQLQYVPVNACMTDHENSEFRALLDEFSDSFATNLSELGCATNAEMSIVLTSDSPINCRPYKIPFAKRQNVNAIVDE